MKKILLFLSFLLMSIGVFGTTATLTLSSSKKFGTTSGSTLTDTQGNTWTCTGNNIQNSYNNAYSGQQFGTASTNNVYTFKCTVGGATITNVSATMAAGNTTPTYDISIGGVSKLSGSLSKTPTTYSTDTISTLGEICITINQNSGNKAVYLGFISVTYTISGYTVTYDNNGGSGSLGDPSSPYSSGSIVTVLVNDGSISKNGYTFDNWITKTDGTGIEYIGGETFTITESTTLYAKWLKDTTITEECNIFHETWDNTTGTGGNDGSMGGNVGTSVITSDNDGWIITKTDSTKNTSWGADRCIRIGIGNESGFAQSPVIQKGNQNEACLTFRAAGWGTDGTVLSLSIDNATSDISSITLTNSTWKTYTVYLTNITDDYTIIWSNSGGKKRFFLDDICITEVANQLDIISWYNDSVIISKDYFDSIPFDADNIRIDGLLQKTSLTENQNGEFNVPVNLRTSYCDNKKFTISDGKLALSQIIRIPRIIASEATTDTISDSDCDAVVQSTLTVSGTASKNRDVKLYGGAHLSVPEGTKYTVNSLSLRRDNLTTSTLGLTGTLNANNLYFDLYVDASDWYWVCLPDAFNLSNLKYVNGRVPTYETDYWARWYDGEHRALTQSGSWKGAPSDTTFQKGAGFLFGLDDRLKKKEFRFELSVDAIDAEKGNKTIGNLYAWGGDNANLRPNHKGWNMIGNPFMNSVVTDLAEPIREDSLVKVLDGNNNWTGQWELSNTTRGKSLRYAVIPSDDPEDADAGWYKSVVLDDVTLAPFTCFFVQIGGENPNTNQTITFTENSRGPLMALKRSPLYDEDEELFLRVKVGNRKTGCFISNKFTDEYEPGDDLESRYPIYQSIGGYKLLYSAINDSIIEHGIQVTAPQGTLYLDPKVDINKFEYIYAHYNDEWYDLKNGQTVEVNGTFILQAKRQTQNVATGLSDLENNNKFSKYIYEGNIYIRKNNHIFTVLGEFVK